MLGSFLEFRVVKKQVHPASIHDIAEFVFHLLYSDYIYKNNSGFVVNYESNRVRYLYLSVFV